MFDTVTKEDVTVTIDRLDPNNVEISYVSNPNGFTVLILSTTNVATAGTAGSGAPAGVINVISVNSNTTLNNTNELVLVDTSTNALTMTMPIDPVDGKVVKIKDKSNNAATNNITLSGNGHNIDGNSTATINTSKGAYELTFSPDENAWFITGRF